MVIAARHSNDLPYHFHRFVVVYFGCALLLLQAARTVFAGLSLCRACSCAHTMLRFRQRFCACWCRSPDVDADEFLEHVQCSYELKRNKHACLWIQATAMLLWFRMLQISVSTLQEAPRAMSNTQDVVYCSMFVIVTVASLRTKRLTALSLDLTYSLAYLLGILFFSPLTTPSNQIIDYGGQIWVLMLFFSFGNRRIVFSNTLAFALACVATYNQSLSADPAAEATSRFMADMLIGLLVQICSSWLQDAIAWSVAKSEVRVFASHVEMDAVKTLLRSVCDAIIELDDTYHLKQHSEQLASVLLKPARNLRGTDLRELLSDDENREAFAVFMASCSQFAEGGFAGVFNARMRDSTGSEVKLECFTVCRKGLNGKDDLMMGIREFADGSPISPLRAHTSQARQGRSSSATRESDTHDQQQQLPDSCVNRDEEAAGEDGLDTSSETSAARDSNDSRSSTKCVIEQFAPTDAGAMLCSLQEVLLTWNTYVKPLDCCPYHASLLTAKQIVRQGMRQACIKDFTLPGNWQCDDCGLVFPVRESEAHDMFCFACRCTKGRTLCRAPSKKGAGTSAPSANQIAFSL